MDLLNGGRMYPRFVTPKTLTKEEQKRLLRAVRSQGSPRDLALLSLALGTGLRLRELAGLNVGDVCPDGKGVVWKVALDQELTKGRRGGVAFLPPAAHRDLRRFLAWKRLHGDILWETLVGTADVALTGGNGLRGGRSSWRLRVTPCTALTPLPSALRAPSGRPHLHAGTFSNSRLWKLNVSR